MLAVQRAEAVADVQVCQGREPAGQCGALSVVLAGLGWLEPDVLEQADLSVGQAGRRIREVEFPCSRVISG